MGWACDEEPVMSSLWVRRVYGKFSILDQLSKSGDECCVRVFFRVAVGCVRTKYCKRRHCVID